MKSIFTLVCTWFLSLCLSAQTPEQVIEKVLQAQQQLQSVSYTLQRTDTFVTGDIRTITGMVKLQVELADSIFGCWFWAKRADINKSTVYDGKKALYINNDKKEYEVEMNAQMFPHILGAPGGQMLLTDLYKLDTTGTTGLTLKEDNKNYYLTKSLPDIPQYDVFKRYVIYTIDKKKMLPIARRSRQETLGKVQDLNYVVKDLWINDASQQFDFEGALFPADFSMVAAPETKDSWGSKYINQPAPDFELMSIANQKIDLQKLRGKVVLLDFLEVWCSPCFASVPKVKALSDKYKSKGLLVYGVSFEKKQVPSMQKLVAKFNVDFPVLIGDDATKSAYDVNAIPRYVLIDKKGNVSFNKSGYSEEIEQAIIKTLDQ